MPTEYIYALVDPRTDIPFYIGRTMWPDLRFKQHMSDNATSGVSAKVAEIRAEGVEPTLVCLEETTDGRRAECEWVQRHIAEGVDLVNCFRTNHYAPNRKPVASNDPRKALTCRLPLPQYERLRLFAFKNEMSHQQVLDEALTLYLDGQGEPWPDEA
jgi:hypothetical protein